MSLEEEGGKSEISKDHAVPNALSASCSWM